MSGKSLLLAACQAGEFGGIIAYEGGEIYRAGFVYLAGRPNAEAVDGLLREWKYWQFVCLSEAWKETVQTRYPSMSAVTRRRMRLPEKGFDRERLTAFTKNLPGGCALTPFDERAFEEAPIRPRQKLRELEGV